MSTHPAGPFARAHDDAVDARGFRRVMGAFATGVAVVTTKARDGLHGMTVNSLTSVSLHPPLLLVCLTRGTRTAAAITGGGWFVVNVLGAHQDGVADVFARPGEDHFRDGGVALDEHDLPVLDESLAHMVCRVEDVHVGGDHLIVLGRVVRAADAVGTPLIFHRGRYDSLTGKGRDASFDWYW